MIVNTVFFDDDEYVIEDGDVVRITEDGSGLYCPASEAERVTAAAENGAGSSDTPQRSGRERGAA